jgi:hypothetical protein
LWLSLYSVVVATTVIAAGDNRGRVLKPNLATFHPQRASAPYDFDIRFSQHGHWIVRDRSDLSGGIFLTYRDAMRFALFETGGTAFMFTLVSPPSPSQGRAPATAKQPASVIFRRSARKSESARSAELGSS